jgi:flavin reductase (DIM6/NTAB) family NADH-FMN oxidoreductase RutF
MQLQAFRAGANILAFEKQNRRYGMCCAWAAMLDYDQIGLLLGSQSTTGKALQVGDVVGVSALSERQADVALRFGEGHSDQIDKFVDFSLEQKDPAILIPGAKVKMVCEVLGFWHPDEHALDRFVRMRVLSYETMADAVFLDGYAV